jgi:hypothetical protein
MSLDGNSDETNGYYSVMKNGVVANANFNKAVLPPIGCVLPWLKTLTGCPALPDGFVECNGQTLDDADSPFDGVTIPDLNGPVGTGLKGRFLRGHTESGLTEDSQNLSHRHSLAGGSDNGSATHGNPAYGYTYYTGYEGGTEARPHNYSVVFIMRIK